MFSLLIQVTKPVSLCHIKTLTAQTQTDCLIAYISRLYAGFLERSRNGKNDNKCFV